MQSVGGLLGTEALPETDLNTFGSEDPLDSVDHVDSDAVWGVSDGSSMLWTCVAAGAVSVDPMLPPNW